MPVISSLVLTNQNPVITYTASVVTSGSIIADGLGNQITFLNLSCSYANTASIQTSWEQSSSYASSSTWATTASYASSSISSSYSTIQLPNITDNTSSNTVNISASLTVLGNSTSFGNGSNTSGLLAKIVAGNIGNEVGLETSNDTIIAVFDNSISQDFLYAGGDLLINSGISTTINSPFGQSYNPSVNYLVNINNGYLSCSAVTASLSGTSSMALTSSHFSPSQGAVTNAGPLTGSVSASGYGFSTAAEFNNFITSVSSSLQQFNTLLTYLRSAGIIT